MAVFRVEKTRNYTVMSNYHLRDKSLSLKAKGLLSLMLSLPEDWDYTTKGLARICKDGVDSICATVRELEGRGTSCGRGNATQTVRWAASNIPFWSSPESRKHLNGKIPFRWKMPVTHLNGLFLNR